MLSELQFFVVLLSMTGKQGAPHMWGKTERADIVEAAERKLRRDLINMYKYLKGTCREQSNDLFGGAQWQDQK